MFGSIRHGIGIVPIHGAKIISDVYTSIIPSNKFLITLQCWLNPTRTVCLSISSYEKNVLQCTECRLKIWKRPKHPAALSMFLIAYFIPATTIQSLIAPKKSSHCYYIRSTYVPTLMFVVDTFDHVFSKSIICLLILVSSNKRKRKRERKKSRKVLPKNWTDLSGNNNNFCSTFIKPLRWKVKISPKKRRKPEG